MEKILAYSEIYVGLDCIVSGAMVIFLGREIINKKYPLMLRVMKKLHVSDEDYQKDSLVGKFLSFRYKLTNLAWTYLLGGILLIALGLGRIN